MTIPVRTRIALIAWVGLLPLATAAAQEPFPHENHEPLFPLCEGCHEMEAGASAAVYPAAEVCARCHDGEQVPVVAWSSPAPDSIYPHPVHGPETSARPTCQDCHGEVGGVTRVADRSACADCHEPHHTGSVRCRLCHVTSPLPEHGVEAHRGCAGAGCHDADRVADLRFDRQLCLVCHTGQVDHKAGRRCGTCHAVGQPTRP